MKHFPGSLKCKAGLREKKNVELFFLKIKKYFFSILYWSLPEPKADATHTLTPLTQTCMMIINHPRLTTHLEQW
jgi:hypothetical protein